MAPPTLRLSQEVVERVCSSQEVLKIWLTAINQRSESVKSVCVSAGTGNRQWWMTDSCRERKNIAEKDMSVFIMRTDTAERYVPARLILVNPCHLSLLFLWSFSVSKRNRMYETVCTLLKLHRDIKTGSAQRRRETAVQECNLPVAHSECRFTAKLLLHRLTAGLHLLS